MADEFQRTGHKPGADYHKMSDEALLKLRNQNLARIKELENPGLVKSITRTVIKGAAGAGAFAAGMFIADKAFLHKQELNLRLETAKLSKTKAEIKDETDEEIIARAYGDAPEEHVLAWGAAPKFEHKESDAIPHNCLGCSGCPAMDMCKPGYLPADKASAEPDPEKQKPTILDSHTAADWIRSYERRQARRKEKAELNSQAVDASTENFGPYKNQMIFASAASSGLAVLAWNFLSRFTDEPDKHEAHHLKHENQHIEDEIAARVRNRLEAETNTKAQKLVA